MLLVASKQIIEITIALKIQSYSNVIIKRRASSELPTRLTLSTGSDGEKKHLYFINRVWYPCCLLAQYHGYQIKSWGKNFRYHNRIQSIIWNWWTLGSYPRVGRQEHLEGQLVNYCVGDNRFEGALLWMTLYWLEIES